MACEYCDDYEEEEREVSDIDCVNVGVKRIARAAEALHKKCAELARRRDHCGAPEFDLGNLRGEIDRQVSAVQDLVESLITYVKDDATNGVP